MKNTPENRAALERIVGTAHFLNTGYRFEIMDYDEFLTLRIHLDDGSDYLSFAWNLQIL